MQINRLFQIIYILLEKKSTTAGELAEHFEVSTRTIYRDIDVLSYAGVPIYMNKGHGGGHTSDGKLYIKQGAYLGLRKQKFAVGD